MVLPYMDDGMQIRQHPTAHSCKQMQPCLRTPTSHGIHCLDMKAGDNQTGGKQTYMFMYVCHVCSVDIFKLYHQTPYKFSRLSGGRKIKIHRLFIKEIYFNIHKMYMQVHIYLQFLPVLDDNTHVSRIQELDNDDTGISLLSEKI